MLRRFFSPATMPGSPLPSPEALEPVGLRPVYTVADVAQVVTASLVELEPPVQDHEIQAIHGLVAGNPPDCPAERELQFRIIAAGRSGSGLPTDDRTVQLSRVLGQFRLG